MADFLMVRCKGKDIVVSVAMRLLLRALLTMATTWWSVGVASVQDAATYRDACPQFGTGLKPTVWVNWVVYHSSWYLLKYPSLWLFSSIPTEYRNGPFKMDMRH